MDFVRQDTSSDPCRVGPDADLTGLGVRIGLYMQCVALSFAAVTGFERTLTVIPSAIMTVLVLNLILAMKASVRVFDLVPTVQDFWVAQTQLFLLTTIVPLTMLFGRWNSLGPVKNTLAAVTILFTYGQAFWFWTSGFERSDERICGTAESVLGQWKLFSQGGRWAIVVLYAFGSAVTLGAVWTYAIGSPGVLSGLFRGIARKLPSSRLSVKAVVLLGLSVPVYIVCIWMVERVVRRGAERTWFLASGQWFALGLGTFSLVEALWHAARCLHSERRGGAFMDNPEVFGGPSTSDTESCHSEAYDAIPLSRV